MRAVIFDLDGTLIDSEPDLRAALNRVLADRGLSPLDAAAVRSMIGDGAKALVERAFAAHAMTAGAAELDDFLEDYEANAAVATKTFPGIEEALAALKEGGHKLAVCTNKPQKAAETVLAALGLDRYFEAVIGGDGGALKPDPRHLGLALEALGETGGVLVGDHPNDLHAARALGLSFVFASWGYGAAEGDVTAKQPADLPELIDRFGGSVLYMT